MEPIVEQFLANFPSLIVVAVILLVAWFFQSESRKTRQELKDDIKQGISARLGEVLLDIKETTSKLEAATAQQQSALEGVQARVRKFTADIQEKEAAVSQIYADVRKRLGQLSEQIPDVSEESADDLQHMIRTAQDRATAARLAAKFLEHEDATPIMLESVGDIMRRDNRLSLALKLFRAAHEKDPQRRSAELELKALQVEIDFDSRATSLAEAKEIALEDPKYGGRVYDAIIHIEDYTELLEFAEEMETRWAADREVKVKALRNKAVALRQTRKFEQSAEAYEEALSMAPDDANVLRPYSLLLRELGDRSELKGVYEKLHSIDPLDPVYCIDLAEYHFEDKDYEKARHWCGLAAALDKKPTEEYRHSVVNRKINAMMSLPTAI